MINLKPCPFCGESNGSLLAFGPVGATKEIRERKQATTCLSCGAEGPAVDRVDGLFTAAADAWNKREPQGAAPDLREAARALLDQIDMMNNPARIGELANPSDEYGYFMILTGDLRKALEASNASPPKAEKSSPSEEKPIQNIAPTPSTQAPAAFASDVLALDEFMATKHATPLERLAWARVRALVGAPHG